MSIIFWTLLSFVTASAVYHLLCLYSASNFFRESKSSNGKHQDYAPPVTVLKPLRGAEEWMHECLASFCSQDYPDYEIIFGVREADDPAIGLIERLKSEFP